MKEKRVKQQEYIVIKLRGKSHNHKHVSLIYKLITVDNCLREIRGCCACKVEQRNLPFLPSRVLKIILEVNEFIHSVKCLSCAEVRSFDQLFEIKPPQEIADEHVVRGFGEWNPILFEHWIVIFRAARVPIRKWRVLFQKIRRLIRYIV